MEQYNRQNGVSTKNQESTAVCEREGRDDKQTPVTAVSRRPRTTNRRRPPCTSTNLIDGRN